MAVVVGAVHVPPRYFKFSSGISYFRMKTSKYGSDAENSSRIFPRIGYEPRAADPSSEDGIHVEDKGAPVWQTEGAHICFSPESTPADLG